jgi:hypothetical protein
MIKPVDEVEWHLEVNGVEKEKVEIRLNEKPPKEKGEPGDAPKGQPDAGTRGEGPAGQ